MSTIEIPTEDSVEMVRAIRQQHYEETRYMIPEEKAEFDRKRYESAMRQMEEFRLAKRNNSQDFPA